MTRTLRISLGQVTDKGRKPLNQDFHGVIVPREHQLSSKGIVAALADGISSSDVSQIASEVAVKGFLDDYYATPESWSVKTAAQRVLQATNSWLYAQTRNGPHRYNLDRGYVCTFSAIIFKSATAHIFHLGDSRICRVSGDRLEQLTEDHRLWVSPEKSYLSRALGMRDSLELEYDSVPLELGDTFVLSTDGIYEYASDTYITDTIAEHHDDLDQAARLIIDHALAEGSDDNLSIQIIRIDELPEHYLQELNHLATALPFPPELHPRMQFERYEIVRELHHSNRSQVYLAVDLDSSQQVALKIPSVDLRDSAEYLERFLMEEWVAKRVNNAHLLRTHELAHKRNYLYTVTEYIEGQTLRQWIFDNPRPNLESVRNIIEQIADGLQALHRKEMLHQDLRPENIMIDRSGTVRIIDFGAVRVAGIAEMANSGERQQVLGAALYSAPEYFLGEIGDASSDLFSLGVITYEMLSGRLPYGPRVPRATMRSAQNRLNYIPLCDGRLTIPAWVDETIRKAVHSSPYKRHEALSEFIHDLRHPNSFYVNRQRAPLIERNPLLFWKALSATLFIAVIALLSLHFIPRG